MGDEEGGTGRAGRSKEIDRSCEISGQVTGRDGRPVHGAQVVVSWQHLRNRQELASAESSAQGRYRTRFVRPADAVDPVLVVVEASSKDLKHPLVSPLTALQPVLTIDLYSEAPDTSEYTALVKRIEPLLTGVKIRELVEDDQNHDFTFLATELATTPNAISRLVISACLESEYHVSGAAFYAFLRQRVPSTLPNPLLPSTADAKTIATTVTTVAGLIFSLTASVQQSTLNSAVTSNQISPRFQAQISELVTQLQSHASATMVGQPFLGGQSTLAALLTVAGLDAAEQETFAGLLAKNTEPLPTFLAGLSSAGSGLTAAQVTALQQTFQVGALVQYYAPLLALLVPKFADGTYSSVSSLAALTGPGWVQLVTQAGAPAGSSAQWISEFASRIYEQVTELYPTAALSSRIVTANLVPAAQQGALVQFFSNNPGLELNTTNIAVYLSQAGAGAWSGIAAGDQGTVRENLAAMQRVLRMGQSTDVASSLMGTQVTSATQIAIQGRPRFLAAAEKAGLAVEDAEQVYDVAALRYAQTVALYLQQNYDAIGLLPAAAGDVADRATPVNQVLQADQSAALLLGAQNYCATNECTSILSPAAYLCDLLYWLDSHPPTNGASPLDVLDARRPDIRHTLLDCPNTDTELPTIDLIIELLADKVAPPSLGNIPFATVSGAVNTTATTVGVNLGAGVSLPALPCYIQIGTEVLQVRGSAGVAPALNLTVVRGVDGTTAQAAAVGAAVVLVPPVNPPWKQTWPRATAGQLAAAPQFFNAAAFHKLSQAAYPQTLPYSTGLDGLRTCLQQWQIPLWQLRQALIPLHGAIAPAQIAAAMEWLEWNPNAEQLATQAQPNQAAQQVAWNTNDFTGAGLGSVPNFLQASNLTYQQLLAFLNVQFVQQTLGANQIALAGVNDQCDTTQMTLAPWPVANPGPLWQFLDRGHRFLRLWNAANCEMWEVDLLLQSNQIGPNKLDESALVNLFQFWQLQQTTNLSVDQLLAFYSSIDLSSHLNDDGSTTPSLYGQVYLNPAAVWSAPDSDIVALSVSPPGVITQPALSAHLSAVRAALGVSDADAGTLVGLTDNTLTLANLSLIYRVSLLAQTAGLSLSNLITLASLLSPSATVLNAVQALFQSPLATSQFLQQAQAILQSSVSLDAITYLLSPPTTTPTSTSPGWATVSQMTPVDIANALATVQAAGASATPANFAGAIVAAVAANAHPSGGSGISADVTAFILQQVPQPGGGGTLLAALEQPALFTETAAITIAGTPAAGDQIQLNLSSAQGGSASIGYTLTLGDANNVNATANDFAGALNGSAAVTGPNAFLAPCTVNGSTITLTALAPALGISGTVVVTPGGPNDVGISVALAPSATLVIGGNPSANDSVQVVFTPGDGGNVVVQYQLTAGDVVGGPSQVAASLAAAINVSSAVTGPTAFLAPCTVAGTGVVLTTLDPESAALCAPTVGPGGAGHVSVAIGLQVDTLPDATPSAFPQAFNAMQLFDKIALLVRNLKLVLQDLTFLAQSPVPYGGLDLTKLPVVPNPAGQVNQGLAQLLATFLVVQLRRTFTAAPATSALPGSSFPLSLYDLINGLGPGNLFATAAQAQAALAIITGWPLGDVTTMAQSLNLQFPADYAAPSTYNAMRTIEAMAEQADSSGSPVQTTLAVAIANTTTTAIQVSSDLGFPAPPFQITIGNEVLEVTAVGNPDTNWTVTRKVAGTAGTPPAGAVVSLDQGAEIIQWATLPTAEAQAESYAASALSALIAQQSTPASWLSLAPTLMNPIRQNRSTALQVYLIAQRAGGAPAYPDQDGNPTLNGLYDYFLIDTQTTSCQQTSRVVQAYIAVQTFVERCLMNLESQVIADPSIDPTWDYWDWMCRFQLWVAAREVFLYPENWLIESNRTNRTEIYQEFEQAVRQGPATVDYLQTTVLDYVDSLEAISDLEVTGSCTDPDSGTIYAVGRTKADPPTYYVRSCTPPAPDVSLSAGSPGVWSGWTKVPLDIKAHHVVPAMFRGRLVLFWMDVIISGEPNQQVAGGSTSGTAPAPYVDNHTVLTLYFSTYRNGAWSPTQTARGKLFDKPLQVIGGISSASPVLSAGYVVPCTDVRAAEAMYTLKVNTPATGQAGYTAGELWIDIFRWPNYQFNANLSTDTSSDAPQWENDLSPVQSATQIGRATFNGRFGDLFLSDAPVAVGPFSVDPTSGLFSATPKQLYQYAQANYGPDAQPLLPLTTAVETDPEPLADADLGLAGGGAYLLPEAGGYLTGPFPALELAIGIWGEGDLAVPFPIVPLLFNSQANCATILGTAPVPFAVIPDSSQLAFPPTQHFFYRDNRRSYFAVIAITEVIIARTIDQPSAIVPGALVRAAPWYQNTVGYRFHPFYFPFARLFWDQLSSGGFSALYDPALQQAPAWANPSGVDAFAFGPYYAPGPNVTWDLDQDLGTLATSLAAAMAAAPPAGSDSTVITVTSNDDATTGTPFPPAAFLVQIGSEILEVTSVSGTQWTALRGMQGTAPQAANAGASVTLIGQDCDFLDFSPGGAFSVYNWELFYHIPNYVALLLNQNLQFQDAQTWYQYIFNPTAGGASADPSLFWVTKPFRDLTLPEVQAQQINALLTAVDQDQTAAVTEVQAWQQDPFDPFALADLRPVAYMKSTVMAYVQNLIDWGDNLFQTQSREAVEQATLLYVLAQGILGPTPAAVTPPTAVDASFDTLQPQLDQFANAWVAIENFLAPSPGTVSSPAGTSGSSGTPGGGTVSSTTNGAVPQPQTFFFKIPSNPTLLAYWSTVAGRLKNIRLCQNMAGQPAPLALFDAPIDPGLLIQAEAAGVDLSSVVANLGAPLPNYRYSALYAQANDFVGQVRAYGAALLSALEKQDANTLALLLQTQQLQLLNDGNDILQWQVQQANQTIAALQDGVQLAQQKLQFFSSQVFANPNELLGLQLKTDAGVLRAAAGAVQAIASVVSAIPDFNLGFTGAMGSPTSTVVFGGHNIADAIRGGAEVITADADLLETGATLATTVGGWQHRMDSWVESAKEAAIQVTQAQAQLAGARLALLIASQNQTLHQDQIQQAQDRIDFLTNKFTSNSLYDWMAGQLSASYFQSYQLAIQLCKGLERAYQFEIGDFTTSFIQFGYWNSLYQGLLAGDSLNSSLKQMQASYLQQNARRYEISRFISLGEDPTFINDNPTGPFQQLVTTGSCTFNVKEDLFDHDYPGLFNRRLQRASLSVVYTQPPPTPFSNVKATLMMTGNKVRVSTAVGSGYGEAAGNADPRFIYNYAAVPQKIVTGNAQDDPGLFLQHISHNLADPRYLPFENAGAISSWQLNLPQSSNEITVSPQSITRVVLHLYYTALDGGAAFQQAVQTYYNPPKGGGAA